MRGRTQFPAIRRALADRMTPEPVCECGEAVPIKHWSIHRATCLVIRQQREAQAAKSDGP